MWVKELNIEIPMTTYPVPFLDSLLHGVSREWKELNIENLKTSYSVPILDSLLHGVSCELKELNIEKSKDYLSWIFFDM